MSLVVDASVAIKWAIDEDGHAAARALAVDNTALVAPDFALAEIANILWKKQVLQEIGREQAIAALPGIRRTFARFVPSILLVEDALILAADLAHPVYDCLYLAAARVESTKLVTADRRLLRAVGGSPYESLVVLLGQSVS